MRRIWFLTLIITLIAPFGLSSHVASAKENAKDNNKAKSSTTIESSPSAKNNQSKVVSPSADATSNQSSTPSSSSTTPVKGQSEVKKTDSNNPPQSESSKKNQSSNEAAKPSEVSSKDKSSKTTKTESIKDVKSSPSNACKSASKAKTKIPQNICYDFLVVFKPGLGRATSSKLLSDSGAQTLREYSNIFNGALVNGPLAKMQALAKNPNILVVEDDLEVKSTAIQSPAPWGLDRIDQKALPLTNSFDDINENGANTFAYVVDTGIDSANVEFEGRVSPGFTAITDGLGSNDCNGHGTHVAGTIGSKTYGVSKKAALVPVRVLDCAGSGTYSSVISGLDWIAANYQPGQAAVVNMSLGGPASSTLDGAVRTLIGKGITVVVAAGNSGADACNYSPARVVEAITVAATTNSDSRASYSNFGSCIDLFAPGSSITSTWIGASGVNTISGTSMATPHVAGTIARFVGFNSGLTPGQIANSVVTSSTGGVVISAGLNSPNRFLNLYLIPDTTTVVPIDSSPTFKKVTPRGKKR